MTRCKTWMAMIAMGGLAGLLVAAAPAPDDETATVCQDTGAAYEMGAPPQLAALGFMSGDWDVEMVFTEGEQEWRMECTATVHEILDGATVLEEIEFEFQGQSGAMASAFTFDRIRDVYRVARIDSMSGMLDVYEGNFDGETLVLDNIRCGTSRPSHSGEVAFTQISITRLSEASFQVSYSHTTDDGETWETAGTMVYTRRA